MFKQTSNKPKGTLRRAGGYRVCDGCRQFPNMRHGQRLPWIKASKKFIRAKLKAGDRATKLMLQEAEVDWMTFEAVPFHRYGQLTPLGKAQTIVAHILKRGKTPKRADECTNRRRRFDALDILATALGADLMCQHSPLTPMQSPADSWRRPFYRAVQIGRAVRYLTHIERKLYELENGQGEVRPKIVERKIVLRSRNACQRLQQVTEKHYGWFMAKYGAEIASKVLVNLTSYEGRL